MGFVYIEPYAARRMKAALAQPSLNCASNSRFRCVVSDSHRHQNIAVLEIIAGIFRTRNFLLLLCLECLAWSSWKLWKILVCARFDSKDFLLESRLQQPAE